MSRAAIPIPASILERFPDPQHARWGMGSPYIPLQPIVRIANPQSYSNVIAFRHPLYDLNVHDWRKWRMVYEGGDRFVEEFTKKFSRRETEADFRRRKEVTPVPAFAKGAINEVKNAIFQRIVDVVRRGGPPSYQRSVIGDLGGVDLKGATMRWFIGHYVIPELLTMRTVGIYVDNKPVGKTLADAANVHPYCYVYRAEDILNWAYAPINDSGDRVFTAVLLRDFEYQFNPNTGLPIGEVERFRHIFIGPDGFVHIQFYDYGGNPDSAEIVLQLRQIPFIAGDISDSLLRDVSNHQIALLNLESSDVSYALKGNFPFYTEQYDLSNNDPLVRESQRQFLEANIDPNCPTEITPHGEEVEVGAAQGRRYGKGLDRPGFISPSAEPLKISMEKQDRLKADIRLLVHLALSNLQPKMASAESKGMDQQGLESGLSYIGLELEHIERRIAFFWSMYENSPEIPTIAYPDKWSLKSTKEAQDEAKSLREIRDDIPSLTFKKEMNRRIASTILGISVPSDVLETVNREIAQSIGVSSDPKTINTDIENGIVSLKTAAVLRGYPESEVPAAQADHAARLARIAEAQTSGRALNAVAMKTAEADLQNPAARGLPDLSATPTPAASAEKIGLPTRGPGQ